MYPECILAQIRRYRNTITHKGPFPLADMSVNRIPATFFCSFLANGFFLCAISAGSRKLRQNGAFYLKKTLFLSVANFDMEKSHFLHP